MKKNPPVQRATEQMAYGVRAVEEALFSGLEIDKVMLQRNIHGMWVPAMLKLLHDRNIPVQYLPAEAMNRIGKGNHQGVVVYLSAIQYQNIESIIPAVYEAGQLPLLLVLDRITDVRNFGAIARTAEGCGVNALVIPARGSAQINADAIKTSSGALLNIAVSRSLILKNTLFYLKNSGIKIIAASENASQPLWDINLTGPVAILMGSEEDGISDEYLKLCDHKAEIPLSGKVASLNVSVAAGIFLYEAVRQRSLNQSNRL